MGKNFTAWTGKKFRSKHRSSEIMKYALKVDSTCHLDWFICSIMYPLSRYLRNNIWTGTSYCVCQII